MRLFLLSCLILNPDKCHFKLPTLKKRITKHFFPVFKSSWKMLVLLLNVRKSKFRSVHPFLQSRIVKKIKTKPQQLVRAHRWCHGDPQWELWVRLNPIYTSQAPKPLEPRLLPPGLRYTQAGAF